MQRFLFKKSLQHSKLFFILNILKYLLEIDTYVKSQKTPQYKQTCSFTQSYARIEPAAYAR